MGRDLPKLVRTRFDTEHSRPKNAVPACTAARIDVRAGTRFGSVSDESADAHFHGIFQRSSEKHESHRDRPGS